MTSCFCLQGRRAGQTQHPSHPVLFSGMLLAALTLQSVPMASSPSPKKGRKSSSMRHLKRKSGLQSPGQPQHTCTHTQAWNGKLTREVPRNHKATFYVYMPACNAVAASLASLSASTTTLWTVPQNCPWNCPLEALAVAGRFGEEVE